MIKKLFVVSAVVAMFSNASIAVASTPEEDLEAFRGYFLDRFSDLSLNDFKDGVYALNQDLRDQWLNNEEFPPYEEDIEAGEEMFNTPFANGKTYADCLKDGGVGTRQMYPYFDSERGEVVTLEGEINRCRTENGEKPLKYKKGKIAQLTAYIAYTSRGNVFETEIPSDDRAVAAYTKGKEHYYMKRGQLNMSCADCHYYNSGMYARSDLLSPTLGQLTHFPVYRLKWQSLGTPHRRFGGCNANIRAKPFKAQSEEYKDLEYFLTYMSQGIEANGPASRK